MCNNFCRDGSSRKLSIVQLTLTPPKIKSLNPISAVSLFLRSFWLEMDHRSEVGLLAETITLGSSPPTFRGDGMGTEMVSPQAFQS